MSKIDNFFINENGFVGIQELSKEQILVKQILNQILEQRHGSEWRLLLMKQNDNSLKKSKFSIDMARFHVTNQTKKLNHPAIQPLKVSDLSEEFRKFIQVGGQPAFGYPLICYGEIQGLSNNVIQSAEATTNDYKQQLAQSPPKQLNQRFKRGWVEPEPEHVTHLRQLEQLIYEIETKEQYLKNNQIDKFYEILYNRLSQREIEFNMEGRIPNLFKQITNNLQSVLEALKHKRITDVSQQRIQNSFTKGQQLKRELLILQEEKKLVKKKSSSHSHRKRKRAYKRPNHLSQETKQIQMKQSQKSIFQTIKSKTSGISLQPSPKQDSKGFMLTHSLGQKQHSQSKLNSFNLENTDKKYTTNTFSRNSKLTLRENQNQMEQQNTQQNTQTQNLQVPLLTNTSQKSRLSQKLRQSKQLSSMESSSHSVSSETYENSNENSISKKQSSILLSNIIQEEDTPRYKQSNSNNQYNGKQLKIKPKPNKQQIQQMRRNSRIWLNCITNNAKLMIGKNSVMQAIPQLSQRRRSSASQKSRPSLRLTAVGSNQPLVKNQPHKVQTQLKYGKEQQNEQIVLKIEDYLDQKKNQIELNITDAVKTNQESRNQNEINNKFTKNSFLNHSFRSNSQSSKDDNYNKSINIENTQLNSLKMSPLLRENAVDNNRYASGTSSPGLKIKKQLLETEKAEKSREAYKFSTKLQKQRCKQYMTGCITRTELQDNLKQTKQFRKSVFKQRLRNLKQFVNPLQDNILSTSLAFSIFSEDLKIYPQHQINNKQQFGLTDQFQTTTNNSFQNTNATTSPNFVNSHHHTKRKPCASDIQTPISIDSRNQTLVLNKQQISQFPLQFEQESPMKNKIGSNEVSNFIITDALSKVQKEPLNQIVIQNTQQVQQKPKSPYLVQNRVSVTKPQSPKMLSMFQLSQPRNTMPILTFNPTSAENERQISQKTQGIILDTTYPVNQVIFDQSYLESSTISPLKQNKDQIVQSNVRPYESNVKDAVQIYGPVEEKYQTCLGKEIQKKRVKIINANVKQPESATIKTNRTLNLTDQQDQQIQHNQSLGIFQQTTANSSFAVGQQQRIASRRVYTARNNKQFHQTIDCKLNNQLNIYPIHSQDQPTNIALKLKIQRSSVTNQISPFKQQSNNASANKKIFVYNRRRPITANHKNSISNEVGMQQYEPNYISYDQSQNYFSIYNTKPSVCSANIDKYQSDQVFKDQPSQNNKISKGQAGTIRAHLIPQEQFQLESQPQAIFTKCDLSKVTQNNDDSKNHLMKKYTAPRTLHIASQTGKGHKMALKRYSNNVHSQIDQLSNFSTIKQTEPSTSRITTGYVVLPQQCKQKNKNSQGISKFNRQKKIQQNTNEQEIDLMQAYKTQTQEYQNNLNCKMLRQQKVQSGKQRYKQLNIKCNQDDLQSNIKGFVNTDDFSSHITPYTRIEGDSFELNHPFEY